MPNNGGHVGTSTGPICCRFPVLTPHLLASHVAVVRTGTLDAAAELLGYSVSSVSQQLAVLERETGQPLWERAGRGVRRRRDGRCAAQAHWSASRHLLPHSGCVAAPGGHRHVIAHLAGDIRPGGPSR
ncbi:MAG: LysR family transcriptional regulator [Nakamurella sp.]